MGSGPHPNPLEFATRMRVIKVKNNIAALVPDGANVRVARDDNNDDPSLESELGIHFVLMSCIIIYIIAVEMKEAYETLQGRRDETGERFDQRLLEEATHDKQKISAMKYVAGAMTHKVRSNWLRTLQ